MIKLLGRRPQKVVINSLLMLREINRNNFVVISNVFKYERGKIDIPYATLGDMTVIMTEYWAILEEIEIAKSNKIRNMRIEIDATDVIKAINEDIKFLYFIIKMA